ncbi:MAG: SUMF1/EgtB/PvdO family nonheme iron enzyme [Deltaproteobacteria bacterium]|nr:SUMF1/EgtB/PvdO family nonheme iron enzyme [Nannocystaceae bacterium]
MNDLVSILPLGVMCLSACTPVSRMPEDEPMEATATRIAFDIPPGAQVSLDGVALGATPVAAVLTTSGSHVVELWTKCGREGPTPIEVTAGATLVIGRESFPRMTFESFHLYMRSQRREPIAPEVYFDRSEVALEAGGYAELVACSKQRLRVESGNEDLGGYMEDLMFGGKYAIGVHVMFAPGPDMVHLPNGKFFLGPPAHDGVSERDGSQVPRREVRIEAFEIDESPVTAAQWHACRKAGACGYDAAMEASTTAPEGVDRCSADTSKDRNIVKGRGNHPMNCVARWEAVRYCEWAGKRLPMMNEWEYAARGGNDENNCPWGIGGMGPCGLRPRDGRSANLLDPVCTSPEGDSIQGVCDLASGLGEMVIDTRIAGRGRCNDTEGVETEYRGPTRSARDAGWMQPKCEGHFERLPLVTFRCARYPSFP